MPNKSAKVRLFLKANPYATPAMVRRGLRSQGVDVSSQLVANVMAKGRPEGLPKKARGRPRRRATKSGVVDNLDYIIKTARRLRRKAIGEQDDFDRPDELGSDRNLTKDENLWILETWLGAQLSHKLGE
jgi:hypothetical protein